MLACDLADGEVPVRFVVRVRDSVDGACVARDETGSGVGTLTVGEPHTLEFEWEGADRMVRSDETAINVFLQPQPALRCDAEGGWMAEFDEPSTDIAASGAPCTNIVFGLTGR